MPVFLVVGYNEYQSGKTIVAGSLISALKGMNYDTVGVKPLAGVDAWEYPWIIEEIAKRKLVVSGDALRLHDASGGIESIEAISPQTLILAPIDPSKLNWRPQDPDKREPILGRISVCGEKTINTLHFINVEALDKIPNGLASAIVEAAGKLKPLPVRGGEELASRIQRGIYLGEIEKCMARILSRHDYVVMESNSDVAIPTPSALGAEWVIVVSNGVVGVVPGERWSKAVEVLVGAGGIRSLTVREVVSLTGIKESFQLPFLYDPIEGYKMRDLDALLSYLMKR